MENQINTTEELNFYRKFINICNNLKKKREEN